MGLTLRAPSLAFVSGGMAAAFQNLPASFPAPYRLESGSPGQCVNTPDPPGGAQGRPRRRRATLRGLGQEVRKPGGQPFFLFHFLPETRRKSLSVPNSLVGGRRGVGSDGHQGESAPAPPLPANSQILTHSPALGSGHQSEGQAGPRSKTAHPALGPGKWCSRAPPGALFSVQRSPRYKLYVLSEKLGTSQQALSPEA